MDGYSLVTGAIHRSSGRFSDFWALAKQVSIAYAGCPFDHEKVSSLLEENIAASKRHSVKISQSDALNILLHEDLSQAHAQLNLVPTEEQFYSSIEHAFDFSVSVLRAFGLTFAEPNLFISDQFPPPYNDMDWVAFAPDEADFRNHGITPGIYLLRGELMPYHSELTIAHELVHSVIGLPEPNLLGRGLEEGIVQIIGEMYIGSKLFGRQIARNVIIHTRLRHNQPQASSLYLDYLRQAYLVYTHFGLDGLIYLVRAGRPKIKEVEYHCLTDNLEAISLPKGGWDKELTHLCEEVLLGYVPNLVVSPLAFHIAKHVAVGQTLTQIAHSAYVTINETEEMLNELQSETFTVLIDGETVIYSDLEFLLSSRALRYRTKQ